MSAPCCGKRTSDSLSIGPESRFTTPSWSGGNSTGVLPSYRNQLCSVARSSAPSIRQLMLKSPPPYPSRPPFAASAS